MSNYPNELDDDVTLPRVDNNITQIGGDAINALRSAVFNIEDTLGINPAGTAGNLAAFLSVAHNPDGSIQPSVLTSLGLVVLPITDSQVSPTAGIKESKLALDYPTAALFSFIQQVNLGTQQSLNFITNHGSKIEPHIQGTNFNHYMNAILVAPTTLNYFTNDQGLFRDNSNLYNLFNDLNTDYIKHQVANNTTVTFANGQQTGGTVPPTNYAHVSAGIYLNTSNFSFIPETTTNLQAFAEFVDGSNVLLLGTRIQTLYQNGIPRTASSSSLLSQTRGQVVIPPTLVTTFLLDGYYTTPVDDINHGDDVIVFNPASDDGYTFDALFAAVRIGDIITVTYTTSTGLLLVSNIVTETKYLVSKDQSSQTFAVRIDGKNLQNATNATATITRSLFNNEKFGVLALAQANHNINGILPTLIVGNPQGAEAFSVNFNAGLIDSNHYNLYLAVYPNGSPINGIFNMPAIDISGNQGATPGAYTIDSVVLNINNKFRTPGYNNRFIAFQYQGNLGIKMTDSINNISFSILDGVINPTTGLYNQALSNTIFPANVIGVPGIDFVDPSGLGPSGAGLSGPQFATSFSSSFAAQVPAKIIAPLTRRTFYVNGSEEERFALQPFQSLDGYGDGYWPATIITKTIVPGVRVETTYQINLNLSTSGLQIGKTLTVVSTLFTDSGRYFISNIQFNDCTGCNTNTPASIVSTNITVYDAIQSPSGTTPSASAAIGTVVGIYFSADSVGFDAENLSDASNVAPFKRHMEIYVDDAGNTFSHERARIYIGNAVVPSGTFGYSFTGLSIGNPLSITPLYGDASQQLILANIVNVSQKLRGFPYSGVDKINLQIISYDTSTGDFSGFLCNFNILGNVITNAGPIVSGKIGEITRFYDQTNVEYIDIIFSLNNIPGATLLNSFVDIQLFPTLSLDQNVMLLGTVQVNNQNNTISYLVDQRQFGNTSEVQFSTSALDFIATPPRYTMQNGIVRGFNLISISPVTNLSGTTDILTTGGLALTNGFFNAFNPITANIPLVQDNNGGSPVSGVLWAICVNESGDVQLIPLTDHDPSVNTINNPGRLLQLFNVVNSQTYYVDSTTFSALINSRKDLTVLWLVNAQVTNSTTYSFAIIDARKYVNDINSTIRPVFTDEATQGNFKDIQSALVWFKYNSIYQNTLNIKSSYTFTTDPGFSPNFINVVGDGYNASFTFGGSIGTYSITNTNFTDMVLTFNLPTSISNGVVSNSTIVVNSTITITNMIFNNCIIHINAGGSIDPTTFNNCTINIISQSVTLGAGAFNNCNITIGTLSTGLANGFVITNTVNGVTFSNCNFQYFPNISSGYSSSNLINSGHGAIYASVTTIQNVTIDSCKFTTNTSSRFSFVSFEYNSTSSLMQSVYITNNKFYNTSSLDDNYAVIAFTSLLTSAQPTEGLKLIDCNISNNICDKNQMISITGTADGSNNINCSIVPVATKITENSCGSISALVAADFDRNYETYTNGIGYDKMCGIEISQNTCRWIGSTQSTGQWVDNTVYTVYSMIPSTAPTFISQNICSWIQYISIVTANSYDQPNSCLMQNNILKSYDPTFLNSLGGNSATTDMGILTSGSGTFNLIGNVVSTGKYLTSSGTQVFDYLISVNISSSGYCLIDGNILNNVQTNNISPNVILLIHGNPSTLKIVNNTFVRNAVTVFAYIFIRLSNILGVIANNSFDHTTNDGSSTLLVTGAGGALSNFVFGSNNNWAPSLSRNISQPLLAVAILGSISDNGSDIALTNAIMAMKITKVVNGATLVNFVITYENNSTLGTAPTFSFNSVSQIGVITNVSGTINGSTGSGFQTTIVPLPANYAITDFNTTYLILVQNSTSVVMSVTSVILSFTNLGYVGQN